MSSAVFSQEQIALQAKFTPEDTVEFNKRRRESNRLGFAYQLAFVRLANRFPAQQPLEVVEELLHFVSVQLGILPTAIEQYKQRRQTIAEHRILLIEYLQLSRFAETETERLEEFLFEQALRLEQTGPLLVQSKDFLKQQGILFPADDTLRRLIIRQRQAAREHIFTQIVNSLSDQLCSELDALLVGTSNRLTPFQTLKQPVGKPSAAAMIRLGENLHYIERIGILQVDISWLNNNYQRSLTRYARRCSADIMRIIEPSHRYAVLTCFLWQTYRDTIDYMIDMYSKLITSLYNRAQNEIDAYGRKQRQMIRSSMVAFHTLASTILDDSISDRELRQILFNKIDKQRLNSHVVTVQTWLSGKYSHLFHLVVQRFSYLRQFAPIILQYLIIACEDGVQSDILSAIEILRELNQDNKRKLPKDVPLNFVPKKLLPLIQNNGQISKRAWECALMTAVRDELQAGNLYVRQSKRYGRFDDFLMPTDQWVSHREQFFRQAGLPLHAEDVPAYFTKRLNQVYDQFIEQIPQNTYISIKQENW